MYVITRLESFHRIVRSRLPLVHLLATSPSGFQVRVPTKSSLLGRGRRRRLVSHPSQDHRDYHHHLYRLFLQCNVLNVLNYPHNLSLDHPYGLRPDRPHKLSLDHRAGLKLGLLHLNLDLPAGLRLDLLHFNLDHPSGLRQDLLHLNLDRHKLESPPIVHLPNAHSKVTHNRRIVSPLQAYTQHLTKNRATTTLIPPAPRLVI